MKDLILLLYWWSCLPCVLHLLICATLNLFWCHFKLFFLNRNGQVVDYKHFKIIFPFSLPSDFFICFILPTKTNFSFDPITIQLYSFDTGYPQLNQGGTSCILQIYPSENTHHIQKTKPQQKKANKCLKFTSCRNTFKFSHELCQFSAQAQIPPDRIRKRTITSTKICFCFQTGDTIVIFVSTRCNCDCANMQHHYIASTQAIHKCYTAVQSQFLRIDT